MPKRNGSSGMWGSGSTQSPWGRSSSTLGGSIKQLRSRLSSRRPSQPSEWDEKADDTQDRYDEIYDVLRHQGGFSSEEAQARADEWMENQKRYGYKPKRR